MITLDGDHGRIEKRPVRVADEVEWPKENHSWDGLKSVVVVTATGETKVAEDAVILNKYVRDK